MAVLEDGALDMASEDAVPVAESGESDPMTTPDDVTSVAGEDAEPVCVVDAIYFHNTLRCRTCKKIEETAHEVLTTRFADAFAEGRLRWSTVNMEKERHFVEQYDLVKPTLVLVRTVGGEAGDWVALDETWSLIGRELRFTTYVVESTTAFLGGCP
jgi:hypothetical protein